jgi:hypothetical protein
MRGPTRAARSPLEHAGTGRALRGSLGASVLGCLGNLRIHSCTASVS